MKEFLKSFFNETFWKFIVVGLINTAVGMGVMYLYYNLINDNKFIAFALNIICGNTDSGWASLMCSIWFIGGLQLLGIGLIGEYIGKMYKEVKRRPRYIVEKYIGDRR